MKRTYLLGFVATALLPLSATSQNAFINGNFEDENTGFETDYRFRPNSIESDRTYTLTTDPSKNHKAADSFGDHTTGSGLMMAINGSWHEGHTLWAQTVSVAPNTDYTFSLWLASWTQGGVDHGAHLEVSINGNVIGDTIAPFDTGTWEEFASTWNSGSTTSAEARILNLNFDEHSLNDFAIDDVSLTPVPEPSGLALFGIAVLVGWRRFARA